MTPFVEIFEYDLPLVRPLSLKGDIISRRKGLILKLGRNKARVGFGEIAPLPGFSIETFDEARRSLLRWAEMFCAGDKADDEEALQFLLHTPSVLFGTECASLALAKSAANTPAMFQDERKTVSLCGLVIGDGDEALARIDQMRDRGFKAVKLKVGRRSVSKEIELVRQACAVAGDMALRLDANRAWEFSAAVEFARGVESCPVDFIEEPLREPHLLPDLAAHTRLPIALDESLIDVLYDDDQLLDMRWAKAVVLKPTLLGGLRSCQELAYEAGERGVQSVVSSSFESGVGLVVLAHFAASLSAEDVPAGLDTYDWLAEDLLAQRFRIDGGVIDLEHLDACAATVDTARMERIFSA